MQLDTDMVVDYADMVYCNDCMAFIRHAMRDIPINSDTLALDAVAGAGPGGNLLSSAHTFSHFKTELWHSDLFDHDNWDKWEKKGGFDHPGQGIGKTRAMLAAAPPPLVSQKQAKAINAIVNRAHFIDLSFKSSYILCLTQLTALILSFSLTSTGQLDAV
jgi:trimethylamine---corrinoid protein Co-methyltransferase